MQILISELPLDATGYVIGTNLETHLQRLKVMTNRALMASIVFWQGLCDFIERQMLLLETWSLRDISSIHQVRERTNKNQRRCPSR